MPERYHLIGIGGSGMSGLARLLLARGASVSGSDLKENDTVRALRRAGVRIAIGHRAENVREADCVVYTTAIRSDNPELLEARRLGLETVVRAEMLARLMEGRTGIAVAGTHGKTTTTAMTAAIFLEAGADPGVLLGGDWSRIDGNARLGGGPYFIAEACEAFDSFLELRPQVAAITNIEADHLDWHGSLEGVITAFRRFLGRVDPQGYLVGCAEDSRVLRLLEEAPRRAVTYGFGSGADYRAELLAEAPRPLFALHRRGHRVGEVRLAVPGRHNVLNALAAAAIALEEGLPFAAVAAALATFEGVGRRLELLGEAAGVRVLDDYAHHPTEVAATLAAARAAFGGRATAVFQPHLYSRTQALADEFAGSFRDADRVLVTEIYAAREDPIPGISGEWLAERIRRAEPGKPVEFVADREALVRRLAAGLQPGDVVITMGAGDIREVGEALLRHLREQRGAAGGAEEEKWARSG